MPLRSVCFAACAIFAISCAAATSRAAEPSKPWLGVHIMIGGNEQADQLMRSLPALGKLGFNAIVVEVNDYHEHLVVQRKVQMLMWGDRLLDGKATGYGEWEAAKNGTCGAIDMIPKDIVICDWHYGKRPDYPSIALFINKGFSVWPGGWDKTDATEALINCERKHAGPKMLGHLCTTWGKAKAGQLAEFAPIVTASQRYESH